MQFVETKDLKMGMRLARPIYSRNGVLLFDRNSRLTAHGIESVKNFGLLGIYVLEPAEPLPPLTEEDLEFERFQTMAVFSIKEEIEKILSTGKQSRMSFVASSILKRFGHLDDKVNFYQNLRSREDYVYRHSLNVAVLTAMITHVMNIRLEEQLQIIYAAIIHDIGKLSIPADVLFGEGIDEAKASYIYEAQLRSLDLIGNAFAADGAPVRRICHQTFKMYHDVLWEHKPAGSMKLVTGARILLVADRYDELTSMHIGKQSSSEVSAIKEFLKHPDLYDPEVVQALLASIHILSPGVSIELSTGEKALVLVENSRDILRPVVLCFKDNSVLDLALARNSDIEVVDIMKTLDNRYIMDTETLKNMGFKL